MSSVRVVCWLGRGLRKTNYERGRKRASQKTREGFLTTLCHWVNEKMGERGCRAAQICLGKGRTKGGEEDSFTDLEKKSVEDGSAGLASTSVRTGRKGQESLRVVVVHGRKIKFADRKLPLGDMGRVRLWRRAGPVKGRHGPGVGSFHMHHTGGHGVRGILKRGERVSREKDPRVFTRTRDGILCLRSRKCGSDGSEAGSWAGMVARLEREEGHLIHCTLEKLNDSA